MARALWVVLLANSAFFVLTLLAPTDPHLMRRRIQAAFQAGDLDHSDYLWSDAARGWHQYNDCFVLQILSNQNSSRLERALAPTTYSGRGGQCALLDALVSGDARPDTLTRLQYARYWHGPAVLAAVALRVVPLRELRNGLSIAVWVAIGLLALVAFRSGPHARLVGLLIAGVAATLWAVPDFAPGLTHGPGDAVLLLMLAGVAARPRRTTRPSTIVPYAAGFGATVVFLDMWTGQLPIAAAWLGTLTLASNRDAGRPGDVTAAVAAAAAVVAFGAGAATTMVTKEVLVFALADPDAARQVWDQLGYYMRPPDYEEGWPGLLEPFGRLVRKSSMLTYGSRSAGYAVVVAMVLAWLVAAFRGWRARGSESGKDVLLLLGGCLIPAAWVLLLPHYAYLNAGFLVRILVAPISLAAIALVWPHTSTTREGRERNAGERTTPGAQRTAYRG